jgi:ubiquinone/menaquinone biosynthesis C-methylase UbiE
LKSLRNRLMRPRVRALMWRMFYDLVALRFRQPEWQFMNYGFAHADGSPNLAVMTEEEEQRSAQAIEMYRQTISGVDVTGKDVLEVASGRGGGARYVAGRLGPRSVIGMDYSGRVVALCKKGLNPPNLSFQQGSAMSLPFPAESFDVVVNIESSHGYPWMPTFVAEATRVLRPSGFFCIADYRRADAVPALRRQLCSTGLVVVEEVDITANVCASLETNAERVEAALEQARSKWLRKQMNAFLGGAGTGIYDGLHQGHLRYMRWVLQKQPPDA